MAACESPDGAPPQPRVENGRIEGGGDELERSWTVPSPGGTHTPRLLFLSQSLPFPPDGGVHIRTFNILRLLARAFDITALCFYRRSTRGSTLAVEKGVEGLREFARTFAYPIPQEYSRIRLAWGHLRSVITRNVYTRFVYESRVFRERLVQLIQDEHFDLVHLDSLDLSAYLPLVRHLPVVCTHHNIESDLLRRRADAQRGLVRRYLRLQAALMVAEERRWCGSLAGNVVVSVDDAARLRALVPQAQVVVVPNGVDTTAFRPSAGDERGIVFVGGYTWYPNRDGMVYFCEEILPAIRSRIPNVPVTWVGRAPERIKGRYAEQFGVTLTGYVEDVRPIVNRAACYIVPLRVGGGTRLKILDAWAMGKAVISTSLGCEGLNARDGENILIRDSPVTFAEAVWRVIEDPALRRHLARGARATATGTYDWSTIGYSMVTFYHHISEGADRA